MKKTTKPSFDRAAWLRLADYLAAAVAVSLPWSSSATSIGVVLWLIVLVPALDWPAVRRELTTWAGGLPVALFLLGALGMLWADVAWIERFRGLESFLKLLVIPLLLAQFRSSRNGQWVLGGFLVSASALLLVSMLSVFTPGNLWGLAKDYGVPVKDYIAQSGEFTLGAFGAFYLALGKFRQGRHDLTAVWMMLGLVFLANILFVTTSRTTLVTIPFLFVVFAFTQFTGVARLGVLLAGIAVVAGIWTLSPYARERLMNLNVEVDDYRASAQRTSAGERIEFWNKAAQMVFEAPMIGHGTGSIREMYRRAAEGKSGVAAEIAANPHNQTFAVAIQIGLIGALLLFAMWGSHVLLFGASGVAIIGMAVVIQNIVGSLFNSHLFDFTHGWTYAFGVGVVGGMVLARPQYQRRTASKKFPRRR